MEPNAAVIGFRPQEEDRAALEQLGRCWGLSAPDVIRRLLRMAAADGRVRHQVDRAAEVVLGIPMQPRKWLVLQPFNGTIPGVGHLDLRAGDRIDGKVAARNLVDALVARDLVEPMP